MVRAAVLIALSTMAPFALADGDDAIDAFRAWQQNGASELWKRQISTLRERGFTKPAGMRSYEIFADTGFTGGSRLYLVVAEFTTDEPGTPSSAVTAVVSEGGEVRLLSHRDLAVTAH